MKDGASIVLNTSVVRDLGLPNAAIYSASKGAVRSLTRALARDLGALVRRMHELGFWHRDLYLCHVFAAREGGGWRLTLIDLARVGRKARPRWRRICTRACD